MVKFKIALAKVGLSIGGLLLLVWAFRIFIEFLKRVIWALTLPGEHLGWSLVALVWLAALLIPIWLMKKYVKWAKELLAEMKADKARPTPNPKWLQ